MLDGLQNEQTTLHPVHLRTDQALHRPDLFFVKGYEQVVSK